MLSMIIPGCTMISKAPSVFHALKLAPVVQLTSLGCIPAGNAVAFTDSWVRVTAPISSCHFCSLLSTLYFSKAWSSSFSQSPCAKRSDNRQDSILFLQKQSLCLSLWSAQNRPFWSFFDASLFSRIHALMRSDRNKRLGPPALAGLHITHDSPEQPWRHLSETNTHIWTVKPNSQEAVLTWHLKMYCI